MKKKVGILRFLGTNCDRDIWQAVEASSMQPEWLWYKDNFESSDFDAFVVPGGFSYGDYLRAGALAARSPVMNSLRDAAVKGKPVLGICNGFQILCESELLPGALVDNTNQRFIEEWSELSLENSNAFFANNYEAGKEVSLPIAHGEGRFYAGEDLLKEIEDQNQVWWRYKNNPNGSLNDIAGVTNKAGNVAALMPHPERALFDWMSGEDGMPFFKSLVGA